MIWRVILLEGLDRPRITVTIRVSRITRDCFYNCIEFLDEVMREISSLDDEMRRFFVENNTYALEEIGRQLLEAAGRGLWDADPDVLDGLKNAYLDGGLERGADG